MEQSNAYIVLDGEDLADAARRLGKPASMPWEEFTARRKRGAPPAAKTDSSTLRMDTGSDEDANVDGVNAEQARKGMLERKTGKAESTADEEPNAAKARKDMIQRKKDGWRIPKKDRGKPAQAIGNETTSQLASSQEQAEGALDDFNANIATSKSLFEKRCGKGQ